MRFIKEDLPHLKWPMLALLAAVVLGMLTVMAARGFSRQAQMEYQSAQNKLNAARTGLADSTADRDSMQSYRVEYDMLLKRGVMGEEQRLDWMEDMEEIRGRQQVPGFSYTISPQHSYALAAGTDSGEFAISASEMTLRIDLLHGGQLMDFLERLRTETRGWFILNKCSIERMADTGTGPRLRATCTGSWLTMSRKEVA